MGVDMPMDENSQGETGRYNRRFKRRHILIVDDDLDQLIQIKGHLIEFYDVTAVRSGHDALKYLESHDADLVLLDYKMPQMDGPDVLESIRKSERHPDIPIVFLTGISDRDTVLDIILELKPQGYLIKPAKKSEIVAKIIDVLG